MPKEITERNPNFQPGGETAAWKYLKSFLETRGQGYMKNISKPESARTHCGRISPYIALGTAMVAAAEQKVDACPMEGFSRPDFDKILGLDKKGLMSTVILPLGYRSEEDTMAGAKKVRKDKETLFQTV